MILLCGITDDAPLSRVRDLLARQSIETLFYDQRKVFDAEIELRIAGHGRGVIRLGAREVQLSDISAVYVRNHDIRKLRRLTQATPEGPEWRHALGFEETLFTWLEICDALVINRPSAMAGNGSKPLQSEEIRRFGFDVPRTLLTTDPIAALAFWKNHGEAIYKSISSVRSVVSRLRSEHLERMVRVSGCPTQFQEFITGQDYRIHVIGEEVYACVIDSSEDDYRYDRSAAGASVVSCKPPTALLERCRALAHHLELPFAGIDLRKTATGRWYCFEVNPSPAFTFYENVTGHPLGDAVVRLLLSGANASAPECGFIA